jgi:site-specific DNA-methyltransferase (adenine-specific)/adenine-specific DNA-methyltransferase
VDIPEKNELVNGEYDIPKDAGTIRVKITDLLSESLEETIHGKA